MVRLDALGPNARRVMCAAAVLGGRFDWSLLTHVTELGEDAVLVTLPIALIVQATAHAIRGEREAMEARIAEAVELVPAEPIGWAEGPRRARTPGRPS